MSRKIDHDKPYSDEDKAYLHSRSRGWQVEANERRFKQESAKPKFAELEGEESEPLPPQKVDFTPYDQAVVKEVQALSDSDLKAECKARGLPATGDKEQLQLSVVKSVLQEEQK